TMTVFVTVGTTSFDELIKVMCSESVLHSRGYSDLVLQVGRGNIEPESIPSHTSGMNVLAYRFKGSLDEDIARASLIISHAGAGSCLEALRAKKPLVAVVNEQLMGNHQMELATQLHADKHLLQCTCRVHLSIPIYLSTQAIQLPGKPDPWPTVRTESLFRLGSGVTEQGLPKPAGPNEQFTAQTASISQARTMLGQ
uniref:UDP-N-acetylglucosamine transferase subunit ALG13 n=1 Tax=Eptatretus burgeri TaxID=7764 RepID=A0A8C4QH24_EPTBU